MIEIGGLTLHKSPQPDGLGWGYSDLIDWYSVPESKSPIRERPASDGAFGLAEDLRSAAVFSFNAFYAGATEVDALMAARSVRLGLGGRQMQAITVTDALGATSRTVSVRRAPIKDHHGLSVVQFSVDMIAPDANRYGPAASVSTGLPTSGGGIEYPIVYPVTYGSPGNSGRIITVNDGDADTFSLLEVTGGMSGGTELTEVRTGQILRFERSIPLGSTVYLNPRTGGAYLDTPGNDVSGFLTRREWWSVPAQGFREIQFNALGVVTGTPTLTARTSPAH
jgi:hypothetical protein